MRKIPNFSVGATNLIAADVSGTKIKRIQLPPKKTPDEKQLANKMQQNKCNLLVRNRNQGLESRIGIKKWNQGLE